MTDYRTIKVYHALYDTGELIDEMQYTPSQTEEHEVSGVLNQSKYSIDVLSKISTQHLNIATTDEYVYPVYAIHNGETLYFNKNTHQSGLRITGTMLNFEIDNSWIVVYTTKGTYDAHETRPAVTYTNNDDVRLAVGPNPREMQTRYITKSTDPIFDFYNININTGTMSDGFYSYGSTYSPTCSIEMMQTDMLMQGEWFRVEFKIFGVWQNFGVFYIKNPPVNTSEYMLVEGIGMLEAVSENIMYNPYIDSAQLIYQKSILTIKGIITELWNKYGIPLVFNFDVISLLLEDYYNNAAVIIPNSAMENTYEGQDPITKEDTTWSSYTLKRGEDTIRSVISKLALALYSNAVERNGMIVITHNSTKDYVDSETFGNDTYATEPEQRGNLYYCPYKMVAKCTQLTFNSEYSSVCEMDAEESITMLDEKVVDTSKDIVYYPLEIGVENGGYCDVQNLEPSKWGNMDFAKYNIHTLATKLGLIEPFYYYPIDTEIIGYSPFVYAGACIKIKVNDVTKLVYVGSLNLNWEGGMISMGISTQADVDIQGANSSSSFSSNGTSSSAGAGSLSLGIATAIQYAKIFKDKVITGSKIADSTIENSHIIDGTLDGKTKIKDATISFEKVDKSFITDLTAEKVYIDSLEASVAKFGYLKANTAELTYAKIDTLESNYVKANELESSVAKFGYLKANTAELTYAKIDTLESNYVKANELESSVAKFGYLKANMANIDNANINKGKVAELFANMGLISSAVISDGHVTGYLDSVEVNADSITAGTLLAERLIIKDADGNYHMLTYDEDSGKTVSSKMDGNIIKERTVTANHLVAHTITSNEITTEDIKGSNGWINLAKATFNYGNKIAFDGKNLSIDAESIKLSVGDYYTKKTDFDNAKKSIELNAKTIEEIEGNLNEAIGAIEVAAGRISMLAEYNDKTGEITVSAALVDGIAKSEIKLTGDQIHLDGETIVDGEFFAKEITATNINIIGNSKFGGELTAEVGGVIGGFSISQSELIATKPDTFGSLSVVLSPEKIAYSYMDTRSTATSEMSLSKEGLQSKNQLLDEVVISTLRASSDGFEISGNIVPDSTGSYRRLGNSSREFASVHSRLFYESGKLLSSKYMSLSGTSALAGNIIPKTNNSYTLGNSSYKFSAVHATTFYEGGTALTSKYQRIQAAGTLSLGEITVGGYSTSGKSDICFTIPTGRDLSGRKISKLSFNVTARNNDTYCIGLGKNSLTTQSRTYAQVNGTSTYAYVGVTASIQGNTNINVTISAYTTSTGTTKVSMGGTNNNAVGVALSNVSVTFT